MPLPKWAPGTLYPPGSLVQPLSAQQPGINQPENPGFETGTLANWSYTTEGGTAVASVQNTYAYVGTYGLYWPGGHGGGNEGGIGAYVVNDERVFVTPGTSITGQCYIMYNPTSSPNGSQGRCTITWFDEDGNQIGNPTLGSLIKGRGNNGKWIRSTVTGIAPANAVYASIGCWLTTVTGGAFADEFSWNYVQQTPGGLIYRAVQALAGYSADTEPVWPLVNGVQVVDNEVTWEAVLTTRIVWKAEPILVSGATEPSWPEGEGASVSDGTISWQAVSRRVTDPKCPNSKIVLIAASKIYAGDGDIAPYSATVNPLDWSSVDDAGYLPTNLQQYGANAIAGMGLYRGNVDIFNAEGMQVWQVDEDPAQSALLDAFPIGCEHHNSIAPVGNDLLFLSALGVRSVGIAGGATNLQAGDVGMPIDPLVQAAMVASDDLEGCAAYVPSAGQYWLWFRNPVYPQPAISGDLPDGAVGDDGTYAYEVIGGTAPYVVEIVDGSLPPGATMDEAGVITYDYTTPGIYNWTAQVTDAKNQVAQVADSAYIAGEIALDLRYFVTTQGNATDYSPVDYDDSAWPIGEEPFGNGLWSSGSNHPPEYYGFENPPNTFVSPFARVWVRSEFIVGEIPDTLRFQAFVDNAVTFYINGVEAGTYTSDMTPAPNAFYGDLAVDPDLLVEGVNVLAARLDDSGDKIFYALRMIYG